jgi:hypothetical protein
LDTWEVDQKYLQSFEMCRRRNGKISGSDRVRNEEVLHRVKEERIIPHTIKRRKVNWIGQVLRRSCLRKHVFEGRIDWTRKRRRRHKQFLDDVV